MNLRDQCYESCKNVKYSLNLLKNSKIDAGNLNLKTYGMDFEKYFMKSDRLSHYVDWFHIQSLFVKSRLQRSSIISINFEESKALTVTKDAKITLPDMIGNIGGTLGVFIGFSFLGLLDTLIEWMQYLQEKIKSLRRPKSSVPL